SWRSKKSTALGRLRISASADSRSKSERSSVPSRSTQSGGGPCKRSSSGAGEDMLVLAVRSSFASLHRYPPRGGHLAPSTRQPLGPPALLEKRRHASVSITIASAPINGF